MPSREWSLRVEDILEAVAKIERYTAGMTFDGFKADARTADAVIRNLEVIGEAAGNIPDEVCQRFPDIPWDKMRGIRNILAHEYFGVSLPIIWQTIKADLPPLVPLLRDMLAR